MSHARAKLLLAVMSHSAMRMFIVNTQLLEFDQAEFLLDIPKVVSMDTAGYIYVPSACKSRSSGKLQLIIIFCLASLPISVSLYTHGSLLAMV